MANSTLPSDIIIDILSRLSSKTLIRFKSVCKKWYSLFNSPNFINLHLSQTLISPNPLNLVISCSSLFSVSISDQNNLHFHLIELDKPLNHRPGTHNFPYYSRKVSPQIIGSVNGVICVSDYDKSSVVLYNPSTKTHRLIPPFAFKPNPNPDNPVEDLLAYGFGFDSVTGDYKVLRIFETLMDYDRAYHEVSVYSLMSDSWKFISDDETMALQNMFHDGMGVFVNEVLHFVELNTNIVPSVRCFNLRNETFSILNLPKFDSTFNPRITRYLIKELGGCLSVMVNYKNGNPLEGGTLARADLWVMKEYGNEESWFRLFSIHNPSSLNVRRLIRPVVY